MYWPIQSPQTCAQAWLAAATAISQAGGEAYNVIVDIEEPLTRTPADQQIIGLVDDFLRDHDSPKKPVYPVSTVANTIFHTPCSADTVSHSSTMCICVYIPIPRNRKTGGGTFIA